jgi:hypothetical protein
MHTGLRTSRFGGPPHADAFTLSHARHAPLSCANTIGAFPSELVGVWISARGYRTHTYQFWSDGSYRSIVTYTCSADEPDAQGFRAIVQGQATCASSELMLIANQGHIEITDIQANESVSGSCPKARCCNWRIQDDVLILDDGALTQIYLRIGSDAHV